MFAKLNSSVRASNRSTTVQASKQAEPAPQYPQDEAPKPWADPTKNPHFNVIPASRWDKGIPVVMGGHLMPSGIVAPISQSRGAGTGKPFIFTYPTAEIETPVLQYTNATAAATGLNDALFAAYEEAVAAKGSFTLALSGGSAVKGLPGLLKKGMDWSKVHVYFVDERVVPHASNDSNYGAVRRSFLQEASVPASQVHAIVEGLNAEQAAIAYEGALLSTPTSVLPRTEAGAPIFDAVLLGMGPDGHVASLFPNRAATSEKKRLVAAVANSPKPPADRITFTLPVINAAKNVFIFATGEEKAEVLQRVFEVQSLPGALPAQLVRPANGKLTWFVDLQACASINPANWGNSKDFPRTAFAGAKE